MTAVCDVAGKTAKPRGWQRLAHVAHDSAAKQPEHRDRMFEGSNVGVTADDQHRVFSVLTSASQAIGTFSSAISFLTRAGKPSGLGASLR